MGKVTYTAADQVYLSGEGRMVYPGETFAVDDDVAIGESWLDEDGKPISARVRKASKAKAKAKADKAKGDDGDPALKPAKVPDYTKMKPDDLRAEAKKRGIATDGLADDRIIESLRAKDAEG